MRRLTALLSILALAACGSEPTSLDDGGPTVVAAISVEQGARQSARPTRPMPDSVVARATDSQGRAVEGRIVEFQLPAGPEAGSVDQQTLATNAQGRVFYELRAGTRAWTSRPPGEDSAYTARLVASVEGRSNEVTEFTFAVQPGEPANTPSGDDRLVEDGTFDQFGADGEAEAPFNANFWIDEHENPVPYRIAITGGTAAEVVTPENTTASWKRRVRATGGPGTGTLTIWSRPDSTESIDGEYEVQNYQADGEQQTWICVAFDPMTLSDCEGPPSDL